MKQPNWKTPLILSATLSVVGGFAYWLQYSHQPKKEKADALTKKPIVLASENSQIALIRVKSSNGLIELKCESLAEKNCGTGTTGNWTITTPAGPGGKNLKADTAVARDLIGAITNATAMELVDLSEETPEKKKSLLDQYGLSPEKRVKLETQYVELVTADEMGAPGKRLAAWFGEEHPLGDKTFVGSTIDGNMNEQTVFIIANHVKTNQFGKSLTQFRDKSIFDFDRKNIKSLSAKVAAEKTAGGKLVFKNENGLWSVNGYEANPDRIETLLSGIQNLKATEFPEESVIRGLKPVVTYSLAVGEQLVGFELFEKSIPAKSIPGSKEKLPAEKHYYLKISSKKECFEVDSVFRTLIDKKISELRNNVILTEAEKVTATKVRVEGPGYKFQPEFEYKNGKWLSKDPAQNWDAEIAKKMIDLLAMTRIQDFVAPAPSVKEFMKLTIGDDQNPKKFQFSFLLVKDKLYARNLNQKTNEAYLMEDSMKPTLPKTDQEWKIQTSQPSPTPKAK